MKMDQPIHELTDIFINVTIYPCIPQSYCIQYNFSGKQGFTAEIKISLDILTGTSSMQQGRKLSSEHSHGILLLSLLGALHHS